MRIQVLIEPELYFKLETLMLDLKLKFRSESEMIRYTIIKFSEYEIDLKTTIYNMKLIIESKNKTISDLENKTTAQSIENDRIIKENTLLQLQNKQIKAKKH